MIKLETHCHSLGGSHCADTPAEIIAERYAEAGYGGIVVTNHYNKSSFSEYSGETKKEKLDYYFSLVEKMRSVCAPKGIKVFYGAEVSAYHPFARSEFTLYGFEERFLYDNKPLFECTQEELFRLADKAGVFMYQTHPFRDNITTGNPKFLHGAECFNGHYHHINNNDKALEFCEKNGLIRLSGTDFHHKDQPITAGIYIPETINDNAALTDYVRSGKAKLIKDEETYLKRLAEYKGF